MECSVAVKDNTHEKAGILDFLSFSMFFLFGGITSLNDVVMPKLKEVFDLNYTQMTTVQFCFFASYFLISIPASHMIKKNGYMRTLVIGLNLIALGCLCFIPATWSARFLVFLLALFVVAAGITIIQVTANPLVISLSNKQNVSSRLTFAHACNSLGTVVAPYLGAMIILRHHSEESLLGKIAAYFSDQGMSEGAIDISVCYLIVSVIIFCWSVMTWINRSKLKGEYFHEGSVLKAVELFKDRHFSFGVAAMFFYIGAEVTIGSLLVNYLILPDTLHLTAEEAGKHLAFYWGGLLCGRLLGIVLLRAIAPSVLLTVYGTCAFLLVILSIVSTGGMAGWAMLAVGLCNSVMFPLIFSLTSMDLGHRASEGSGLICMAIVGGAFVPVITGRFADITSLNIAFIIPALCYLVVILFGFYSRSSRHKVFS
ncbi:glucose/galactose MFS transporter [Acetobacter senegalensis]|uniref:glucose/galactose MFS transporter n=1 Tax=Acetobacter senegalensis TaxID=446692 RepID=UPI00264D1ACB|nr:glucose/galactose MFS transporter [Acetobacter senegalensis]MDN7351700.1 glucose/galactose MFS transporter [Acetobacter senegalensis]